MFFLVIFSALYDFHFGLSLSSLRSDDGGVLGRLLFLVGHCYLSAVDVGGRDGWHEVDLGRCISLGCLSCSLLSGDHRNELLDCLNALYVGILSVVSSGGLLVRGNRVRIE